MIVIQITIKQADATNVSVDINGAHVGSALATPVEVEVANGIAHALDGHKRSLAMAGHVITETRPFQITEKPL
jgi:hypothetical protein